MITAYGSLSVSLAVVVVDTTSRTCARRSHEHEGLWVHGARLHEAAGLLDVPARDWRNEVLPYAWHHITWQPTPCAWQ